VLAQMGFEPGWACASPSPGTWPSPRPASVLGARRPAAGPMDHGWIAGRRAGLAGARSAVTGIAHPPPLLARRPVAVKTDRW